MEGSLSFVTKAKNLYKRHNSTFIKTKNIMKQIEPRLEFKDNTPIGLLSKNNIDDIIVLSNIPADGFDKIEKIASDLKSSIDKYKRIETKERAIKFASKREQTTIVKYLQKYSNLQTKLYYRDHDMNHFVKKLSTYFADIRVVFCEKPEDYFEMFKVMNGSCMQVGSLYNEITKNVWPKVAEDTGVYPSAWYHYQPYAKGGFCYVKDKLVGRFMLYRTDLAKDEWPFFGDIKAAPYEFYNKIMEYLTTTCKKTYKAYVETLCRYEVPGIKHELLNNGKTFHCTLANCDNQKKDFAVLYDPDRNIFIFDKASNLKGGLVITNTYTHNGFIDSSRVPTCRKET